MRVKITKLKAILSYGDRSKENFEIYKSICTLKNRRRIFFFVRGRLHARIFSWQVPIEGGLVSRPICANTKTPKQKRVFKSWSFLNEWKKKNLQLKKKSDEYEKQFISKCVSKVFKRIQLFSHQYVGTTQTTRPKVLNLEND